MTVFGAGTMIGGPLAGWLSDHHGWQWSFWVQVSTLPTPPLFFWPLASGTDLLGWCGTGRMDEERERADV